MFSKTDARHVAVMSGQDYPLLSKRYVESRLREGVSVATAFRSRTHCSESLVGWTDSPFGISDWAFTALPYPPHDLFQHCRCTRTTPEQLCARVRSRSRR